MSQASRLRALEVEGLLHPRADAVNAELFVGGGFFLAADKVQVSTRCCVRICWTGHR